MMLPPGAGTKSSPVHHIQASRWHPIELGAQLTRCPVIWRPWTLTMSDTQPKKKAPGSRQVSDMQGFHHPVRLFMPRSKIQDYLSHLGRKVLASFPVQATLHFYNDDSSSEDEDETEIEFRAPGKRST
ncbi:protein ripply3 [Ictalurus punctatus]|uniref:Protein ripply3 n=1 Tax=Ictalurus punctatus TaxID=7998 RepID=A0A2D0SR98_ICTPU|nr:protein ripply3 [Ictalurus punctatus]